ncbi:hypothetical protein [Pelagibius sp.]|uniref:hypothetical protein n=1 Tax=Pelagibius sp. TaxID=1931238 RepID=UPI003BAF05BB
MFKTFALAALAALFVTSLTLPAQAQFNPFQRSGFELTQKDIELLVAAAAKLYQGETAEVGTVETWSNETSGNTGAVQLIRVFEHKGLTCRRLQHDIQVSKVANTFRYIFDRCKTESGEWKVL